MLTSIKTDATNWKLSSWLSGIAPTGSSSGHDSAARNIGNSDGDFQSPAARGNPPPSTQSEASRATKKRKTMDEVSDTDLAKCESTSLEEIASSLRMNHARIEERLKRTEERERRADARAERIESLLKCVLDNQKKILSGNGDAVENEEESETEAEGKNASQTPGKSTNRRTWSAKEYELVAMGIGLYGKDPLEISNLLEDRNRNQIYGFINRNWKTLKEESKQFHVITEKDKMSLLTAIKSRQEEDDDMEDSDDEDNEVEVEDTGGNEDEDTKVAAAKNELNSGTWTEKEHEELVRGIAVHGKTDYRALSDFVKTRSPRQTRMFIYRRLRDKDSPN